MIPKKFVSPVRAWSLPLLGALLTGCSGVVLKPSGDMAAQQAHLITVAFLLMLAIIVPVIGLSLFFAWRYRASNKEATYEPEFHHSNKVEFVAWGASIVIIIILASLTWIYTHRLDPYRPLERISEGREIPADVKPLQVQVVAMRDRWLFIYPEQGVAVVNELAAPVDRPIEFSITGTTVMNSFFIPSLAGQIYSMPGMQTKLHAVINKPGEYEGFSANYSGANFSGMRFKFHGVDEAGFEQWLDKVKAGKDGLDRNAFLSMEALKDPQRPYDEQSVVAKPVQYFGSVDKGLYDAVLRMCVDASKPCTGGHYMGATAHAAAMEAHGAGEAAAHDMHDMAGMHDMHEAESAPAAADSAK